MQAPHNGSLTSRLAADSIVQDAATLRQKALQALLSAGADGLTREELQDVTGMSGDTLRPRVWELLKSDAIRVIGDRTRQTRSGRWAEILTAY